MRTAVIMLLNTVLVLALGLCVAVAFLWRSPAAAAAGPTETAAEQGGGLQIQPADVPAEEVVEVLPGAPAIIGHEDDGGQNVPSPPPPPTQPVEAVASAPVPVVESLRLGLRRLIRRYRTDSENEDGEDETAV